MRLSRDLLMRGITYKLQERPLGGLSKSIIRKLERLNLDSKASFTRQGGDAARLQALVAPSNRPEATRPEGLNFAQLPPPPP
jgi:hypothetical protein